MMGFSVLSLSSLVSTLGGLVFGYELGIISGALLQLQREFRLSCIQQEAVVSALLVGALLASVVGGCLIDRQGRRQSILLSNVLILAGSLVLINRSILALVVGRVTVGFAMCISSMSCCIFVSEMVTPKHRGLLVTLYEVGITLGILAAYGMNFILADKEGGWKYMFGLAIVPTLLQFVSIWSLPTNIGAPESRSIKGQAERELIQSIENEEVDDTESFPEGYDNNVQYSVLKLFQRKDNMRTRTIIGLGLVIFQQFTGQPNVLFYASTIFHSVGFHSNATAVLASVGLGTVKVIATLVSMAFADRVGRRPLLIGGCSIMAVCLITIGLLSGQSMLNTNKSCGPGEYLNKPSSLDHPSLNNQTTVNVSLDEPHRLLNVTDVREWIFVSKPTTNSLLPEASPAISNIVNWIILICMMAVISAYSIGFGPMTWLVLSEIFPARVRGRAFAFTNCFNWAANLIVTFSFLHVIEAIGLSGTFLLYGLIASAAVAFFFFMLPETKGKSLEEIDEEFSQMRAHKGGACCNVSSRTTPPQYQRMHCLAQ